MNFHPSYPMLFFKTCIKVIYDPASSNAALYTVWDAGNTLLHVTLQNCSPSIHLLSTPAFIVFMCRDT